MERKNNNTFYNAGKCDACGCHLTLLKEFIDDKPTEQKVIGHDETCKVK